jgi:hypothetical protein
VVEVAVERRKIDCGGGVTDSWDETRVRLRCSCGGELAVWKSDWPGRRMVRDCGCGVALLDGRIVSACVSMPLRVKLAVGKHARQRGTSFSRAVQDLVEAGLAAETK